MIEATDEQGLSNEISLIDSQLKNEDDRDEKVYQLYSLVYDAIFYEIALKRSKLSLQTRRLLETLALPVNTRNLLLKEKLLARNEKLLVKKS